MQTFFAKEPPAIERRDGHFLVMPTHGNYEVAITPNTLRKFVRRAVVLLEQFDAEQRVVPMQRR